MKSINLLSSFYNKISGPYYWLAGRLARGQQKGVIHDLSRLDLRKICEERGRPDLYDGLSKLIVIDRKSYAGYMKRYENEAKRPLSRAKIALNIDHDETALASSLAEYRLTEEETVFAAAESAPKLCFEIEETYRRLNSSRNPAEAAARKGGKE